MGGQWKSVRTPFQFIGLILHQLSMNHSSFWFSDYERLLKYERLSYPITTSELVRVLVQNDSVWSIFKEKAAVIASGVRNNPGFEEILIHVSKHNDELLAKSDLVTQDFDHIFTGIVAFFKRLLFFVLIANLIVFMVGFIVFSRIIRPVIELSGFVERVSRRDFPQWIALPESYDEVSQLVSTSKGPIKVWRSHTM